MTLCELIERTGDSHFSAGEREQVRGLARDLNLAMQTSAAVEVVEDDAVAGVIESLRERHPRFGQLQPNSWERLAADLKLVLRNDVRALALGDLQELDGSVLVYLRSILAAYRLSPAFVRECFSLLRDRLSERLSAEQAAALNPYLQRNIDVLSDVPEPAAPVA